MLPNLGYFKGIDCPSLKHDGQCTRPYCQFRHADFTAGFSKDPTQISLDEVNKAIKTLKSKIADVGIAVPSDSDTDRNEDSQAESSLEYKPYGAAADLYKGISNSEKPSAQPIDHSALQHKPRRKSFLQSAKGPSNKQFRSMCQTKKSKVNYTLDSPKRPANDLEYDPLCNYDVPDFTDKQKKDTAAAVEEGSISDNDDDLPASDLVIDDPSEENKEHELVEIPRAALLPKESKTHVEESTSDISEDLEKATNTPAVGINEQSSSSVIDLTLWESDSDRSHKIRDADLFGTDSDTDMVIQQTSAKQEAVKKDSQKCKVEVALDDSHKQQAINSGNADKSSRKIKLASAAKTVQPSQKTKKSKPATKKTPPKSGKKEQDTKGKKKQKRKNSDTSCERPKKIQALPQTPNISDYVDKREIERLDEELNGMNAFEECFQIYKESFASSETAAVNDSVGTTPSKPVVTIKDEVPAPSVVPQKSKRKAHEAASTSTQALLRVPKKAKRFPTPAQAMLNRLNIVKEEQEMKILNAAKATLSMLSSSSKGRVAHLPTGTISSTSLSISKKHCLAKHVIESTPKSVLPASSGHVRKPFVDLERSASDVTSRGTVTKGCKRVAHVRKDAQPGDDDIEKPRIQPDRYSKVPSNIRQRYLTLFIDECLRIFNQDRRKAYSMAEMEEKQCKDRSNMRSVYMSVAASTLKKLRSTETVAASVKTETMKQIAAPTKKPDTSGAVRFKSNGVRVAHGSNASKHAASDVKVKPNSSRNKLPANKKQPKGFSVLPRETNTELTDEEVYERMCNYIMTEEQLAENGYPRPSVKPGSCEFFVEMPKVNKDPTKKICSRCGKEFVLYKGGRFAKQDDECIYHWSRAYITKVGSTREKRYNCCQNTVGSEGCSVGETHVHQDNKLDTGRYVRTLDKTAENRTPGIYSLDCEMVHTTVGLELVRVSVVNYDCNVVYDTFVRPEGKILDYNTRWSGVTEEHLVGVTTSLRDVQAHFLSKFSSDTILMGHSLESDLIALRLIHSSVVDTSIVFPHRLGPPYKRALRNLMSEFLGVLIQNADDEGHDSSEDATACIKLMRWKINEDMKVNRY